VLIPGRGVSITRPSEVAERQLGVISKLKRAVLGERVEAKHGVCVIRPPSSSQSHQSTSLLYNVNLYAWTLGTVVDQCPKPCWIYITNRRLLCIHPRVRTPSVVPCAERPLSLSGVPVRSPSPAAAAPCAAPRALWIYRRRRSLTPGVQPACAAQAALLWQMDFYTHSPCWQSEVCTIGFSLTPLDSYKLILIKMRNFFARSGIFFVLEGLK